MAKSIKTTPAMTLPRTIVCCQRGVVCSGTGGAEVGREETEETAVSPLVGDGLGDGDWRLEIGGWVGVLVWAG